MRERLEKLGTPNSANLSVELKTGKSGQFDVTVDGALKYTRSKTGRFPTEEEIEGLLSS